MALRLWVEAHGTDDADLFAGVEKWRGRTYIPFEGSYGFGRDRITTGWLKASLRALDEQRSRPFDPVPTFGLRQPLAPGQIVPADLTLGPSATFFRAGETLRLVVAGRWLWPRNPLTGQFPAAYQKGPEGRCTLHGGPEHQARLLVPIIPAGTLALPAGPGADAVPPGWPAWLASPASHRPHGPGTGPPGPGTLALPALAASRSPT